MGAHPKCLIVKADVSGELRQALKGESNANPDSF